MKYKIKIIFSFYADFAKNPPTLSYGLRFRFFFIPVKIYRSLPGGQSFAKKLVKYIVKNRPPRVIYDNILAVTRKIHVESFRTDAKIGLNDAYKTSLAVGIFYIGFANVIPFLFAKLGGLSVDYVNAVPEYNSFSANGRVQCILKFNFANIMFALIKAAIKIRRNKNG